MNKDPTTDSALSFWIKFFTDAGILPSEAANYAVIFTDHRIQSSMLVDLNKEYLTEMGIKCMGDVIAILKHAKTLNSVASTLNKSGIAAQTSRRSTAASRIVSAYIGNTPEARPMNEPGNLQQESQSRSSPISDRGSVFNRLGISENKQSLTSVKRRLGVTPESVTAQLGKKSRLQIHDNRLASSAFNQLKTTEISGTELVSVTSTCPDSDDSNSSNDSPLPYLGVLKKSASTPLFSAQSGKTKLSTVSTKKMPQSEGIFSSSSSLQLSEKMPKSEGIFSSRSSSQPEKKSARQRLGTTH